MERNYYVYQHTRLDTNEVFYIGISKVKKYKRARDKYDRSDFWKRIVNKTKYKIDILYENLTLDEANEIEINLISHYGRRNLGLGNLVNLTDGSSGVRNQIVSNETRLKQSLANTKHKSRKVINIETGEVYNSCRECCNINNLSYNFLQTRLTETKINDTFYRYLDIQDKPLTRINTVKLKVICLETKREWDCIADCARDNNLSVGTLQNRLNNNSKLKNTTSYRLVGQEHLETEYLKPKLRKVINTETNEIYESIKQCAEMNNISYKKLGRQMCGDIKNNTKFKPYAEL